MVHLPANYSTRGRFPVFLYLAGGTGGAGSEIDVPRSVIGDDDYIVVNFPLFRKPGYDQSSCLDGIIVGADDYPAISAAYKTMLGKLNEMVPNIDSNRSIIGGHSNGAKTVAVLLSALDENCPAVFSRIPVCGWRIHLVQLLSHRRVG